MAQLLISQKQQQSLDAFTTGFQQKWRDRTDCAKGYVIPDCSNGKLPPQQGAGLGQGPQPPAKSGAGSPPALGGSGTNPAVPGGVPGAAAPGESAARTFGFHRLRKNGRPSRRDRG